jgi:hypothetical protein
MNDVEGLATVFNGAERSNIISFIVNGNTEEENSVILTKIFESIEILCPHVLLDTITYETELQKGEYTFTEDSAEFWKDSEWVEGSWLVPIVRENIIDKDDYYQEGSVLRGRWVKITLSFKAGIEFQISDIITTFNKSFS